jgi:flavin-dependent dehydrogenase
LNYDVVVVGASSAGLFAAEMLAKSGKSVAVFDRSIGLEPEERTYIITPGLYQVMNDIPAELIDQEIDIFKIQSGDGQAVIPLASPDLIIDRAELIKLLASRAETAGVALIDGCEFLGFKTDQGKTRISMMKDQTSFLVSADYLIGADGVHSSVRESLKIDPVPSVPLLQAVIDLPEGWDSRTTKVWFDTRDTPYFYWLIPNNSHQGVVGLISEPGVNIKALLDSFLARHEFEPIEYQSGQAALHGPKTPREYLVGSMPVILVGDAAGQVKVTTVGGTVTGFVGAQEAVDRISGKNNGLFRSSVKSELDLHLLIRRLLDQMDPDDYVKLISMLNQSVTKFLSSHDRDNMRSHFWKLIILQPRFIPFGLKLVSRSLFNGLD